MFPWKRATILFPILLGFSACTESNPKLEAYTHAAWVLIEDIREGGAGLSRDRNLETVENLLSLALGALRTNVSERTYVEDGEVYAIDNVGHVAGGFRWLGHQYKIDCDYDKTEHNYKTAERLLATPPARIQDQWYRWWYGNRALTGVRHELANLYMDQGRYPEAEDHLKRAYEAFDEEDKAEGHEAYYSILGDIYKGQGRYKEAEDIYRRWSAYSGADLAEVLYGQQRYEEAELAFKEALTGIEDSAYPTAWRASALEHYAEMLRTLNRHKEAVEYRKRAQTVREARVRYAQRFLAGEEIISLGYCTEIIDIVKAKQKSASADSR